MIKQAVQSAEQGLAGVRLTLAWCGLAVGQAGGGFGTGRAAFPGTKVGKVSGLAGIGGVARVGLSDTMTFFT